MAKITNAQSFNANSHYAGVVNCISFLVSRLIAHLFGCGFDNKSHDVFNEHVFLMPIIVLCFLSLCPKKSV